MFLSKSIHLIRIRIFFVRSVDFNDLRKKSSLIYLTVASKIIPAYSPLCHRELQRFTVSGTARISSSPLQTRATCNDPSAVLALGSIVNQRLLRHATHAATHEEDTYSILHLSGLGFQFGNVSFRFSNVNRNAIPFSRRRDGWTIEAKNALHLLAVISNVMRV